jgi:hypothetical protein
MWWLSSLRICRAPLCTMCTPLGGPSGSGRQQHGSSKQQGNSVLLLSNRLKEEQQALAGMAAWWMRCCDVEQAYSNHSVRMRPGLPRCGQGSPLKPGL